MFKIDNKTSIQFRINNQTIKKKCTHNNHSRRQLLDSAQAPYSNSWPLHNTQKKSTRIRATSTSSTLNCQLTSKARATPRTCVPRVRVLARNRPLADWVLVQEARHLGQSDRAEEWCVCACVVGHAVGGMSDLVGGFGVFRRFVRMWSR